MSLKIEFVERASALGANVSALCREYGVSRETGHKWLRRFREGGYGGLEEQSRRPDATPLAVAEELVLAVLEVREAHPTWGPKKLVVVLHRKWGDKTPSVTTIARILNRFGKVRKRRRRRPPNVVERAPEVVAEASNEVWTIDFKGWWRTRDGSRCEPLTVRDAYSRYILAARVMSSTAMPAVKDEFVLLFRRYGVPAAIQCDNGPPFICVHARGGLTQLSAWWLSLGVRVVRSRPACPQDNGGHERMHRDIRHEVQSNPQASRRDEQRALDRWRQEFNHVRPHEALDGKVPADLYKPAPRTTRGLPRGVEYDPRWLVRTVYGRGVVCVSGEQHFVSRALTGHRVALEPLGGLRHRVWLRDVDLGELEVVPSAQLLDAATERLFRNTSKKRRVA